MFEWTVPQHDLVLLAFKFWGIEGKAGKVLFPLLLFIRTSLASLALVCKLIKALQDFFMQVLCF